MSPSRSTGIDSSRTQDVADRGRVVRTSVFQRRLEGTQVGIGAVRAVVILRARVDRGTAQGLRRWHGPQHQLRHLVILRARHGAGWR